MTAVICGCTVLLVIAILLDECRRKQREAEKNFTERMERR